MRKPLALIVAVLASAASGARAQGPPVLLSTEVDLRDFGVGEIGDVVYGRVSIVDDPAGRRLVVHFLRTSPAPDLAPSAGADDEPASEVPPLEGTASSGQRALWVWNTADLLADQAGRDRFLSFVTDQRIDRVFLYLPAREGQVSAHGFVPFDGAAVGSLVGELSDRGALTSALDGDPDYIRPENREGVLRTVRRVADFNRRAPAGQRLAGVHYDVEPYLARGFQGPRRAEILGQYTRLIEALADAAHEEGLSLGVDIPFWLDERDEATGEPFDLDVGGVRRPVLDEIFSHVDDVAVMAYRTAAFGPNGVVTQASREVARASRMGVGVYVGLETTHIYDEELHTFRGSARSGLPKLPDAPWVVIEPLDGPRARVWYVSGAGPLDSLAAASAGAPLHFWFARGAVQLPGSALSFQSLGVDSLHAVSEAVVRGLGGATSFRGIAFHDYLGMQALLGTAGR